MTTTAGTGAAARAVQVWKVYGAGETEVVALRDVSVELERGKFTAIMGPSGSGKSTLMHCLAGLDSVSRGVVFVGDTQVTGLNDAGLTRLRRDKIGFVFQQFNLLPTLTAEENILLPLSIAGRKPDPDWYRTVIDTVHLGDRLSHRPSQLSGGQQQRVACARALVARPEVIFADEPTGNLDSRSGADVLTFLRDSVKTHGQTIVMVTHDPVAASYADRVLFLGDGAVVDEIIDPTADSVLDRMRDIDAPEDEGPRRAGPIPVSGSHARESRGTTDPTGRTPHPGHIAGDRSDIPDPHRTDQEVGNDGGHGDPGSPKARRRSKSKSAAQRPTIQAAATEGTPPTGGATATRSRTTATQSRTTEPQARTASPRAGMPARQSQVTATRAQMPAARQKVTAAPGQVIATQLQPTAIHAQTTATQPQTTAIHAQTTATQPQTTAIHAQTTATQPQATATHAPGTASRNQVAETKTRTAAKQRRSTPTQTEPAAARRRTKAEANLKQADATTTAPKTATELSPARTRATTAQAQTAAAQAGEKPEQVSAAGAAPATPARRKAGQTAGARPTATRPPKGKLRKRSSPPDGADGTDATLNGETAGKTAANAGSAASDGSESTPDGADS